MVNPEDMSMLHRMLNESARRITTPKALDDIDSVLPQLIEVAVIMIPGAEFGGVTLLENGSLTTRAPSDPRITEIDALQARLGEGPCVTALQSNTSTAVQVDDFALETARWPSFAPAAVEAGMNSLMSFTMAPRDAVQGAVNLYSTRRAGFGPVDRALGEAFAAQIGVAVFGARAVAHLHHAIGTRDVIGQAKGVLMERFDLTADEAFGLLVRTSQETNIKLYDVATSLTTDSRRLRGDTAADA